MAALGVALLAFVVRVPMIGMAVASPDTGDYLARAQALLDGNDFVNPLRTPAFPLLLAAFEGIGLDPWVSVGVLQNVLGVVMAAAILLVGWRFFNPATGVIAGLLAATSPLLVITEQLVLTDYLFGVAMFAATVLLAEAVIRLSEDRPAQRWLIAAGAMFGLATLMRGNGQYAIVAIPVALLLGLRDWRRALRPAGVSVAAMVVVIAPWVLHNLISYGTPMVTTLGGEALYARVIDHDRIPPPDDSPEGRLARHIFEKETFLEETSATEAQPSGFILAGSLERAGKSNVETSEIMTRLSLEAISQQPSVYLSKTWDILGEYRALYDPGHDPTGDHIEMVRNQFQTLGPGISAHGRETRPGDSSLTRDGWEIGQLLERLVYLLSFGGLLTLALPFFGSRRSRIGAIALLTVVLLGVVVGAATEHYEARYDMPFASMIWLLMAAASVGLVRLLALGARAAAAKWLPKRA